MKDILKIELKRAFKSKGMLLAVFIGRHFRNCPGDGEQIPAFF